MTDTHSVPTAGNPLALFRAYGGQLRLSEALALGMNRYQFYRLRDDGLIEPVSRGLYRLTELPPVTNPDLLAVASRFPEAVLCLVSALAWHQLTTQVPRQIHLAVARNARPPRLDYPPVQGYRFSGPRFADGVETHDVDGAALKIYSAEKTLSDCFAYRNTLGMDVVLEALKLYPQRRSTHYSHVLTYARLWRQGRVMQPYLEASR